MTPLQSRHAFTLIELLTVIVIIGVLSAIILPTMSRVRVTANMSKAQANLRQLGVATQVYVADTGKYPHGSDAGLQWGQPAANEITPTWRGYWSDILSPYLNFDSYWGSKLSPIFDSPGKSVKTAFIAVAFTPNPQVIQDTEWGGGHVIPAIRISRPSETILLGDAVQDPTSGYACFLPWQQPDAYTSDSNEAEQYAGATANIDAANTNQFRFRYDNRGQFLFCDGHVALVENGKIKKKNFAIGY